VLPGEDIVYLGDTARVPYGTKGEATVTRYALACANHLVGRGVKAIVVACNTVSAIAPARLRVELDLPVLGVIEPGARAAASATKCFRVGVLATAGTIASGAYPRAIAACSTRIETYGQAAPLLVPLAEEGWTEGDVPRLAARRYLEPLARAGVDVVILGCTHYPLLYDVIAREARDLLGDHVTILDSASVVAREVSAFLSERALLQPSAERSGSVRLCVTDVPKAFSETASRFLGADARTVEQIDI
jgi:glutamate racemase